MAIEYQKDNGIFTIHTLNTTYQMMIDEYDLL